MFFARSREVAGTPQKEFDIPTGTTTDQFVAQHLLVVFPQLQDVLTHALLSVNLEYIERGTSVTLHAGDEVAVIPPISGG